MKLPIAIHKEKSSVFGVTVPDIEGCHSWGDSIEEAISNAEQAIYGHLSILMEDGKFKEIKPSEIEDLTKIKFYKNVKIWSFVDIDLRKVSSEPVRVNLSIPSYALYKIDEYVKENNETRSGFVTRVVLKELERLKFNFLRDLIKEKLSNEELVSGGAAREVYGEKWEKIINLWSSRQDYSNLSSFKSLEVLKIENEKDQWCDPVPSNRKLVSGGAAREVRLAAEWVKSGDYLTDLKRANAEELDVNQSTVVRWLR